MANDRNWGGRREGSGRRPGPRLPPEDKASERIVVCCTKEQKAKILKAASETDMSPGGFLLELFLNTYD